MKKLTKIIACIVLAFFSIVGLSGCTTEEVKENTTAGVEASTNIIPVGYSQDLAKNLFVLAVANMVAVSHSVEAEVIQFDSGYSVNHFTESFENYYLNHSNVVVDEIRYEDVYNTGVNYSGKYYIAKLKDTTDNTEKYYTIYDLSSEEEDPHIVKAFQEYTEPIEENIVPLDFAHILPYITSGMCYGDGFSYINAIDDESSITFKIKDGLIYEASCLYFDYDTKELEDYEHLKFYYDLPALNIPETVQELAAEGYVRDYPESIFMDRFGIVPPMPGN